MPLICKITWLLQKNNPYPLDITIDTHILLAMKTSFKNELSHQHLLNNHHFPHT